MGKKPDQIEHDIREHRAQITRRIEGLRERVNEDVQTVRSEASDRASSALEQAKGTANVDTVKELMRDHTLTTMAGALGVGVLLGVVSEGIGSRGGGGGRSNGYNGGRNRNWENEGGGGMAAGLTGMLSSLVSPAAMTAQNELQQLVKESFETLKQQVSQAGNSGDSTNGSRESDANRENTNGRQSD